MLKLPPSKLKKEVDAASREFSREQETSEHSCFNKNSVVHHKNPGIVVWLLLITSLSLNLCLGIENIQLTVIVFSSAYIESNLHLKLQV